MMATAKDRDAATTWAFAQGDEITPRHVSLQLLGGGSRYEVYLAWDDHLYSQVVVKIARPHVAADRSTLRGLAREIEILDRLDHPMLVRSFGGTVEGDRPHVVLEYLEGPHLARLVRRAGVLPLEQFVPLALQVASVVHYLGNEGVVHLDIKPRNIIMGAPPRVIDLSVARDVERAKKLSGHVGTDLYMAPEQCDPERWGTIGTKTDIWGLGCTLYYAVEGKRPFARPKNFDRNDLRERFPQLMQPPEPLSKAVPSGVEEIVMACLQDDPSERPDAQQVTLQLEPVLGGLPTRRILGRPRPSLRRTR